MAVVLAGLALLVAILVGSAARLTEMAAIRWLTGQGVGPVALSVRQLDADLIHLVGISVGPGPDWAIDDLKVRWSLGGLRAGHLAAIEAHGVRGTLRRTDDGVSLGALDVLLPSQAETTPAGPEEGLRIPLDRLDLQDIALRLEAGENAATVRGNVRALFEADLPSTLHGALDVSHASEPLEARVEIDWRGTDADVAVRLVGESPAALAVLPGFESFEAVRIDLVARGDAPLRDALDIERLAALIASAAFEGRGDVRLEGLPIDARGHDLDLAFDFSIADRTLDLELDRLTLAGPVASVGSATASARLSPGDSEQEVRVEAARILATGVRGPGVDLASLGLEGSGHGTGAAAQGTLTIDGRANTFEAGDTRLKATRLTGTLGATLAGERVEVTWADCLTLAVGKGSGIPGTTLARKATLCLRSRDRGITYTVAEPWQLHASVGTDATGIAIDGDGSRLAEGKLPALEITLDTDASGTLRGSVGVRGGNIVLPDQELRLADFDGRIVVSGTTSDPRARVELTSVQVSPTVEPAAFVPLRVSGEAEPQGEAWRLDARIEDPDQALGVDVHGALTLAAGSGSATVDLNYLGERAPAGRVLPIVGELAGAFNGDVVTHLDLEWKEGRLEPRLRFEMVGGVDQPRDPGAPKTLALTGTGGIDMESGDAVIDVEIPDLALKPLLSIVEIEGLEITGGLRGGLQLANEQGGWVVRRGRVDTLPEGGTLRYRPAVPPAALQGNDQSQVLIREALTDFRYEKLSITVEGQVEDKLRVKLAAWGSNPEVQNGTPIHFNLDLSLDSGGLLRASRLGQALMDAIERKESARTLQ